jgi:hypothetical protein
MLRFALVLLFAMVAWVYWPATGADFVIDDYVFIAQSRMIDAPLVAFWSNHFYEPVYFRPIGVVLWWVAVKLLDLNYAAHSAINLALHLANVALIAYFVRTVTERTSAAIAAATLFALLPWSLAATFWPSNRFDLLAVFFLLWAAIACSHFLSGGRPLTWFAAGIATLAACFSKELAFPIATAMACLCWFASPQTAWQRRAIIFVWLGVAISFAFAWRHWMLPLPYAVASADVANAMSRGAIAWANSIARVFEFATAGESVTRATAVVALLAFAFLTLSALFFSRRKSLLGVGVAMCAAIILAASVVPQWPLADGFSAMLDGAAFGTISYARFYYAPMAALAILIGFLLERARLARSIATVLCLCAVVIALQIRDFASEFATWTQREIRPMSIAAARVIETIAQSNTQPCVAVFLGTQTKHTWFRMFSDVTVKALAQNTDATWRCQVLTESTPWIFISPANAPLPDLGLSAIPLDAKGTPKPDYVWGGVRYRYRTMIDDVTKVPNARFFDWNGTQFVEVTDAVRSGSKAVKTHGWGF